MKMKSHKLHIMFAGFLLAVGTASTLVAGDDPVNILLSAPPAPPSLPMLASQDQLFRTVPPGDGKAEPKEATWLGVFVQETSEPLTAQLDLKPGQGLVVNYVATN